MLLSNTIHVGIKPARTRLDAAIAVSIVAMGTLNLLVLADQIAPAKAYAAAPCNCAVAGVALA